MNATSCSFRTASRFAIAFHLFCIGVVALAGPPASEAARPTAIDITPSSITLNGPRSTQQLLVTGRYADSATHDLTRTVEWSIDASSIATVANSGLVSPRQNGTARLKATIAGLEANVVVTVKNMTDSRPVSFRREFMPVLSLAGCSDIRCHGSPSGKDGFRLSLWGADPQVDFRQLTRDVHSRRTNSLDPNDSLILKKALGQVPHVGGRRFRTDSRYADLVRQWQREQARMDVEPLELKSLSITPAVRILRSPSRTQQIAAVATFSDESTVDVTRLTTFSSSDVSIANVDQTGLVQFKAAGEVAILCRYMGRLKSIRLAHIAAPAQDYQWPDPPEHNYVDQHIFAKLKLLSIAPSGLCSDEQFVRRLYIDLCGRLPSLDATRSFLADTGKDKRERLVEELLSRDEFAVYWTKKWLDVLRVSRDSVQWAGAKALQTWLADQIANDVSFAEIAREMLVSTGESFKDGPVNFYCAPQVPMGVTDPTHLQKDLAEATGQLFMGVRFQCARCHNHPYERWTQQDYLGLTAHFTQIKRERLGKAGPKGRAERRQMAIKLDPEGLEVTDESTGATVPPQLPGVPTEPLEANVDRRKPLVDWLTDAANPFFAKAIVNRVWFHLHGRGIVEPVDDFRDSNPPVNDELLEELAGKFIESGFRLKPLLRDIVKSRTYQLSSTPTASNQTDDRYFSRMMVRPLPAEVLLDSIGDVTGVPEQFQITADYTIGVPEGFVDLPQDTRAVDLPVNDILTLINTGSKYVRYESHPFLRSFGQPTRTQTCECDREQHFGRKQALELIIGEAVSRRLAEKDNRIGTLLAAKTPDREFLDTLYLYALSRRPSQSTADRMLAHVTRAADERQAWEDVLWTILNSQEFIYQH